MATEVSDFATLFTALRREWDLSEETLKAAEQINGEVVFPSVMELRYAGRRAVDALNEAAAGNLAIAQEYLNDAIFNCYCARHDAIDAGTAVIAQRLERVSRQLGYDVVLQVFPGYAELYGRISRVRAKIRRSRGDRSQRDAIYASIQVDDLPSLTSAFEFESSEPLMRRLAARNRRRLVLGWLGASLVALIALASLLRDYFGWTV